MSILSLLLATACGIGFISVILFLLFGQITVRKLRKNPATKHELGTELVSGWDIVNAAQALAVPESIIRKFKNSALSPLYANADVLFKHTNKLDKLLAFLFYWLMMLSGLSLALLALLDVLGVFG